MIWLNANGGKKTGSVANNWNNSAALLLVLVGIMPMLIYNTGKNHLSKALVEGSLRLAGAAQVIEAHCIGTVTSLWEMFPTLN
jgi:uncharacterized ion transporter superfamily protein YfcC